MDWTDYDRDGQATLVLSLVTGHGRAAPLLWVSVWKDELSQQRNAFEDACLVRLKELVPEGCTVTILADRGFGDQNLFGFLAELGFGYVIRFRGNIQVTDAHGETRPAAEWVGTSGRARKLREARVTAKGRQVGAVVCVRAKGMKDCWPATPRRRLPNWSTTTRGGGRSSRTSAIRKTCASAWGSVRPASANRPGATVCF